VDDAEALELAVAREQGLPHHCHTWSSAAGGSFERKVSEKRRSASGAPDMSAAIKWLTSSPFAATGAGAGAGTEAGAGVAGRRAPWEHATRAP
jgi:hypothetical protein